VFDPAMPSSNVSDVVNGCGDPTPFFGHWQYPQDGLYMTLGLNTLAIKDNVNATWEAAGHIEDMSGEYGCSADVVSRTAYTYYSGDLRLYRTDTFHDNETDRDCYFPQQEDDPANICQVTFFVNLKSTLGTTQTSARGMSTLEILLAESAILGGVMFFTWFCSIFMLTDAEREHRAA
jgi:hypothetical protein